MQRYTTNVLWDDAGGFREREAPVYRAADVDALLASIRAAVDAERRAANLMHNARFSEDEDAATTYALIVRARTRAALDALLAEEGE